MHNIHNICLGVPHEGSEKQTSNMFIIKHVDNACHIHPKITQNTKLNSKKHFVFIYFYHNILFLA